MTTIGTSVDSASGSHHMQACKHKKADARILIHLQDALNSNATTCLLHTVDTNVIVITAGKFYDLLQQQPATDIRSTFETTMKFRYIHINTMCNTLELEKSTALPVFICLLVVMQLLHFWERKRSAWEAWKSFHKVTTAFLYIANHPKINIECEHFKLLECFCVSMTKQAIWK